MAVAPMIADGLRSRLLGGRRPNGVAAAELVPLLGGSARGRRRAQPRQRRRGNVDDNLAAPSSRLGGLRRADSLEGAAAEDGGQAVVDADRPRGSGGFVGGS